MLTTHCYWLPLLSSLTRVEATRNSRRSASKTQMEKWSWTTQWIDVSKFENVLPRFPSKERLPLSCEQSCHLNWYLLQFQRTTLQGRALPSSPYLVTEWGTGIKFWLVIWIWCRTTLIHNILPRAFCILWELVRLHCNLISPSAHQWFSFFLSQMWSLINISYPKPNLRY